MNAKRRHRRRRRFQRQPYQLMLRAWRQYATTRGCDASRSIFAGRRVMYGETWT